MNCVSGYAARNPGWLGPPQVRRRVAVRPRPEASAKLPPAVSSKAYDARSPRPVEASAARRLCRSVISAAVSAREKTLNSSKAPAKTGSAEKFERPSQLFFSVPRAAGVRLIEVFRATAVPLT
jgi:hypothetical protein